MDINQRLKKLRKAKGINQEQAAFELGISLSSYQKYERDKNSVTPSLEVLLKLADFYNVSTDYLLARPEAEVPNPLLQLTDEELEKKLIESYLRLPKVHREALLQSLREVVSECCENTTKTPK